MQKLDCRSARVSAVLEVEIEAPGGPRLPAELQKLIAEMADENPTWGEEGIAADLL